MVDNAGSKKVADPQQSKSSARLSSVRKVKSVFGSASRLSMTRGFARRHLWIWPVLAIVVLAATTTWVRSQIESGIQQQMEGELRALLDADVTALELWLRSQEDNAITAAQDQQIRQAVLDLVKLADGKEPTAAELLAAEATKNLAAELKISMETLHYYGYAVIDRQGMFLAARAVSLVGQMAPTGYSEFVKTILNGRATVSRPVPSLALIEDEWGELSVGVPVMYAGAPVRDDADQIVAVLALRIRPDQDFTRILNVARFGESGETYAFDKNGMFLSRSRFEDDLKRVGLQVDQPKSRSVLAVEIRDPGVDLTQGQRAEKRRQDQPLTFPVAAAVAGTSGVNVEGYRDYRGVESIAAWTWLPVYGMGVVTEIDKREAFRPIYALRAGFWTLFAMLSAAGVGLLVLTLFASRLDRRMRDAVIAAGQLGQYALEQKIGEGGMGAVYRARHAMLRRPTAVKLLEPSKTTDLAIARFEREVQMTSQLNHPNTITIYDYGRTNEGVFYYAMEFLEGFSLQTLVERFGPLPDGRVTHILLQVCGSLAEAHALGLMHRDIKPANIMLTRRAGMGDFAKLLDFGLVKAQDTRQQTMLTATDSITGTPLYMSPETIRDPDQVDTRSDLYSLGGVAYFLLTGRPVFEANTVLEIIRSHVEAVPISPSQIVKGPIAKELEQVVMACLAKSPGDRPQTAAELAKVLEQIAPVQPWTSDDAERWWAAHDPAARDIAASTITQDVNLSATVGYSDVRPEA